MVLTAKDKKRRMALCIKYNKTCSTSDMYTDYEPNYAKAYLADYPCIATTGPPLVLVWSDRAQDYSLGYIHGKREDILKQLQQTGRIAVTLVNQLVVEIDDPNALATFEEMVVWSSCKSLPTMDQNELGDLYSMLRCVG